MTLLPYDKATVDVRTGLIMENYAQTLKKDADEEKEVCEYCNGTGEIEIESYVYANEPHRAYLGETRVCLCQIEK